MYVMYLTQTWYFPKPNPVVLVPKLNQTDNFTALTSENQGCW